MYLLFLRVFAGFILNDQNLKYLLSDKTKYFKLKGFYLNQYKSTFAVQGEINSIPCVSNVLVYLYFLILLKKQIMQKSRKRLN